ncbi:translational elongation factor EF-1 alpha [Nowakowskiella sp. JEL0407]|nr:translational elongation factor EF-1 alpha [Nowakowskiella sp. JEL0407]
MPSATPSFDQLALVDKAVGASKPDNAQSLASLKLFSKYANEGVIAAQPFLCKHLGSVLALCADKKASKEVKAAAEEAVKDVCAHLSSNAVRDVLPTLLENSDSAKAKWQTRVAALKAIAALADSHAEQIGVAMPDILPVISGSVVDTKADVTRAAEAAMTAVCDVVGNRDLEHMTGPVVRVLTHPEEVKEIMHKLAGVTFVQAVESPALAMVTPLLVRGLQSGLTATMRQSAVIIDNMSKLVNNPLDAAPFMGILLPALAYAADTLSDPEARGVAEKTMAQMNKLNDTIEKEKVRQQEVDLDRVIKAIYETFSLKQGENDVLIHHIGQVCCSLMSLRKFEESAWKEVESLFGSLGSKAKVDNLRSQCEAMITPLPVADEEDDDAEELCNCTFTLAYGTKTLLHNTNLRLKRGGKYGLLGGNDSGKTTLMRSIANGSVEGFPDPAVVRTVFVEADILGELSHLSCVDYVMQDPRLAGLPREEVTAVLATVGFTPEGKAKPNHAVSTLSGGWRMKLALARAMLQKADILLLDEPTNHLDVINVQWVMNYINSLKNVTCIMVSHDSKFLNQCCTHILRIDRLKLHQYRGNLDSFIKLNPDAASYFSLRESKLVFKFPEPGPIEGIKSRSKALMRMVNCDYTYPGNTTPTLFNISIVVSMASRVGCVGENGAGKSTMIKVLTGEVVPQTGEVWKHPNARIAYVAQHAFHHIEAHLDKTPNEYIRWRYSDGTDKESLVKVSMVLTEEEKKLQKTPTEITWLDAEGKFVTGKRIIASMPGNRRQGKNDFEYEVIFDRHERTAAGIYLDAKTLTKMGWSKNVKAIDARIAQTAGQYVRTLSSTMVEQHLKDVGLEPEFATHYRMSALSGGQKVKVVMAAALWMQPHILILDEPTNYLDREALGALAKAIEDFGGGVVIISHNSEFVSQICKEEWVMDAGHLTTKGDSGWMDRQQDRMDEQEAITTMTDAHGNVSAIKQKKKYTKREEKVMIKTIKAKIAQGVELDDDEDEFANDHNLY